MPDTNKKYRSILPQRVGRPLAGVGGAAAADGDTSTPPSASGTLPSTSGPLPSAGWVTTPEGDASSAKKRKRVGTQVACNACRQRKARCDGERPTCGRCLAKKIACIYADEEKRSSLAHSDDVHKVLELIRSEPKERALEIFKHIRETQDVSSLLPTIRGALETGYSRSLLWSECTSVLNTGPRHTIGLDSKSTLDAELMAGNPVSYPPPPSLDAFSEEISDLLLSSRAEPSKTRDKTYTPGAQALDTRQKDSPTSLHRETPTPARSRSAQRSESSGSDEQTTSQVYCDERLRNLDISFWTQVPITSECAARVISLYLETDHPLLGAFDPDMFVEDLTHHRHRLCSPFLVNTLLFLACQMYSAVDENAGALVQPFCDEAEKLLKKGLVDSLTNLAALQLLSLAFIGHGKDHCVLTYRNEAYYMGRRMYLLGVDLSAAMKAREAIPNEMANPSSYAAWGTFNWIVLTSLFYQQPGFEYPETPPLLPIPEPTASHDHSRAASYMGETFPALCKFWRILHGVTLAYYKRAPTVAEAPSQHVTLDFAELKYRELLAWSETLPPSLVPAEDSPHHVIILHIWLHAAILDLFRPFLPQYDPNPQRLKTFYSPDSTPDAAFKASVKQLKRLVIFYRARHPSSTYTMLWHTALIYIANAVLQDTSDDPEWRFYLLLCVWGYIYLRPSYRLAEASARALLSMTLRHGAISSGDARRILKEMEGKRLLVGEEKDRIRATFMADLTLAMTDPDEASVEKLSQQFEDLALFREFTNMDTENMN